MMKVLKTTLLNLILIAVSLPGFGQKKASLHISEPAFQANGAKTAESAKAAIAVSQSILEGNWQRLDSLLDDHFTYTGDGYVFTKDQYIGFMQDMRAAFSNFDMILEKIVVDGDFVSIRFNSNVINTGKFMGAPANKRQLQVGGIFMRQVKNGKIMQEWQTTDLLGTMHQIGFRALFGYAVFVGGFKVKQKAPVRKPNDFQHINGKVENFDLLSGKQKNKYVKRYLKEWKHKK
jgi:predicted ester cyclase